MKSEGEDSSHFEINADELPEGWISSTIGEIADVVAGGTPTASDETNFSDSGYPWITPADLSNFTSKYIQRGRRSLSEKGLQTSAAKMLPKGTVLMSSRAPIGYVAIAANPISTNQGFKNFICHEGIIPDYVYYWIKYLNPYLEGMGCGSTFAEISGTRAKKIPIKYPPHPEQQQIVTRIETVLTTVDAARDQLSRVPSILKRFRQAVLAAACSGFLTEGWRDENPGIENASLLVEKIIKSHKNDVKAFGGKAGTPTEGVHDISNVDIPNSWTICELKYLSKPGKPITYGILKPGPDTPDGIPYVRVADFPNNKLNLMLVRRTTPEIASNYKRSTLSSDDLLLSIRGTVGRVCLIPSELNGGNITQDSVRISVNDSISRKYIELYLQTPSVQKRFENAIKGVAIRGVNVGDVRALQVALPPLAEQHEIVRRLGALFEHADAIEREVAAATKRAEALTQAILGKAFRGELVTPGIVEGKA